MHTHLETTYATLRQQAKYMCNLIDSLERQRVETKNEVYRLHAIIWNLEKQLQDCKHD